MNVYIRKRFAYIIPNILGSWGRLSETKFLNKLPDWFVYYGYWNNTDKDERCSDREWSARRDIWNELLENPNRIVMNHTIVDMKAPYRYDRGPQTIVPI